MTSASEASLAEANETSARVKSFVTDQGRRHPAFIRLLQDSLAAIIKGKTAQVEHYLACFKEERELEEYTTWIVEASCGSHLVSPLAK
ncbi:hypothetical protein CYMTET_15064 [Cymbomonas tetramitiformis]|uniref:Uncharacterized protein n=1 Tax=Cymbomonas tetramitiformis TaxID=36881 RepID=A0AAE0GF12_9CHLO|nr:hypothetical protein CYMTET_15064 [Cymbomonas tetramitiformis]